MPRKFTGGVRSSIDVGRLGKSVSRPGIDPRLWLTLAIIEDVAYDPEEGMFADVQFLPDGDYETCLIGSDYAGDGYGTFTPPKVGDLVLVAVPSGDVGIGPIVVARLFSGEAPPPPEFQNEAGSDETDAATGPTTVVEPAQVLKIVAKEGATIRFEVDGSGKVEIAATGAAQVEVTGENAVTINSPDVRLGDTAGNGIARIGDLVIGATPAMQVGPGPAAGSTVIPVPPLLPTALLGVQISGQITSGKSSVKA
jgi:microcystin-dependent protein